jgi:hypothetical protein
MAAPHAFQLTVVNCPSQVRDRRVPWGAGRSRIEEQKQRERLVVWSSSSPATSTMARLLFRFLDLNPSTFLSLSLPPTKKTKTKKQDLAKTNLAFVSDDDPATAYPFLEVNGW